MIFDRINKIYRAFALIELLVAMTIMALLLVMLMSVLDGTAQLWRENENRVDSYREARAALSIIARDLNNIVSTTNSSYFLFNGNNLPGSAIIDTNKADSLFFLTALPRSAQWSANINANKSDICQVGYFVAFAPTPGSTKQSLNLYRYFRASDETFTILINTNLKLFDSVSGSPPDSELLARNIVGFKIAAYTNANSEVLNSFSSNQSSIPKLIEIEIVSINQETAKKLGALSTWQATNSPPISIAKQTFRTRIVIPDPQ